MPSANNNSQFIYRRLLTEFSIQRGIGARGPGMQFAPRVTHTAINGSYFKRDRQRPGHVNPKRAPGELVKKTQATQGELAPFHAVDRSIIKPVPLELVEGVSESQLFDELNNAAIEAQNEIIHAHEKDVNALLWHTTQSGFNGIYGSAAVQVPSTKWDANGGAIFNDVKALADTIYKRSGHRPNTMGISNEVLGALQGDPNNEIGERLKYTRGDVPTSQILAQYFSQAGISNVIVMDNLEDGANPGQSENFDFMWGGDNVGLFYIDPRNTRLKNTLASTFVWENQRRPFMGVFTRYNEDNESYEVKVGAYYDVRMVDNFAGGVLFDVLT